MKNHASFPLAVLASLLWVSSATASVETAVETSEASPPPYRDRTASLLVSVGGIGAPAISEGTRDRSFGLGVAAFIEALGSNTFGLETGFMVVNRVYEASAGSTKLLEETNRIQIPILFRYWPAEFVSIGVGPFGSIKSGSTASTVNPAGLATSAHKNAEFGAEAALTFNFRVLPRTAVFVEGRVTDSMGRASDETSLDLIGLAGFKFEFAPGQNTVIRPVTVSEIPHSAF
jgi:hypothetical protein